MKRLESLISKTPLKKSRKSHKQGMVNKKSYQPISLTEKHGFSSSPPPPVQELINKV